MSFLCQVNKNARHFLVICLVLLLYCYQIACATGSGGKQKYLKEQKLSPGKGQNATARQEMADNPVFSALSRILPDHPDINSLKPPGTVLRNILNASGVLGLGFLWIKEISAALGTPILAPILIPPLVILSAALLLIPDLQRLGEILDGAMTR